LRESVRKYELSADRVRAYPKSEALIMPVIPFKEKTPVVSASAFVAPDAWIIGDTTVGENVSIFFNAVLRGDIQPIRVGRGTNLQEHTLVHTSHGMSPALIGEDVTVGHRAIIHGCSIGDRCLIGMGATVLDNAEIGEECIIGAHTLVPKGMKISPRSLVIGTPGKVVRTLTEDEIKSLTESARGYQTLGATYGSIFPRLGT
jgi:carbonic anhydrase/acetyltransferase-like protein (isoleucine patch superfamily)